MQFLYIFWLLSLINAVHRGGIITGDPSIIIRNYESDYSYPPNLEFKHQQSDRLLRGSLSHTFNQTTKSIDINTTLIVLDIPQSARSKWCSFHLDFEQVLDFVGPVEFLGLWSLETLPLEFETTWNTRPNRKLWLGTITTPELGVKRDSIFTLTPISVPLQRQQPDSDGIVFPCQLFIGKNGFELAALPTHPRGFEPWTWRSAGLKIKIHDDPWTLLPQYNFTIDPSFNSTLWISPEFDFTNSTWAFLEFSDYSVMYNIDPSNGYINFTYSVSIN